MIVALRTTVLKELLEDEQVVARLNAAKTFRGAMQVLVEEARKRKVKVAEVLSS